MSPFDWRGPAMQIEQPVKRGRPRIYDDEERAQRHREAALRWYHAQGRQRRQTAADLVCFFTEAGEADRKAVNG